VEVSAAEMPGVYRLDLSDAVCLTGVGSVIVMLQGAADMAPVLLEIQLVGVDLEDSVRAGLTALPNAEADAAGGLPISDAGALDLDALAQAGDEAIAQAVWDRLLTAITTTGSVGKLIKDNLDAAVSTRLATAGYTAPLDAAGVRTALGLAAANLDSQLGTISTAAVLMRKFRTNTIRDKSGEAGTYEVLDDDDTAVVATIVLSAATPYQTGTLP
jgi:hypothetical protein